MQKERPGCGLRHRIGIPVAWKVLVGQQPESWHPHWCHLLRQLHAAVGPDYSVVVLSDRGLESPRLFREITAWGWNPLMRVKRGGKFRPDGWQHWYRLGDFVRRPGQRLAMTGHAYKSESLACTLLACWEEGYEEPWLLLTDLTPRAANPCWYAWRAWIEQGFQTAKSAGLDWQHTRMTVPERAERHFLAIAVTLLWLVVVGAECEHAARVETIGPLLAEGGEGKERVRRVWLFVRGMAAVLAALINGSALPHGTLPQQSWPEPSHMPTMIEEEFLNGPDLQL